MKLPIFAACLVAGSTWSFAFADQTRATNPKTAPKAFSTLKATGTKQTPQASGFAAAASSQGSQQMTQGGTGASQTSPTGWGGTMAVGGGDDCASADVISGYGTFAFDCTAATTTIAPPFTCGFGGTDVWFSWTAPSTESVSFSTCAGTTADSVLAVYSGSGCGATLVVCLDDSCAFQTKVNFAATAGSNYMLRIGGYNGSNIGAGTFDLSPPPPPAAPCSLDDGVSEDAVGLTAGGDLVWLNPYGTTAVPWSITSIEAAWGSLAAPSAGVPNGTLSDVFIYSDPNQDGDPNDAVLLRTISTTVAFVDSDAVTSIPVAPPELVVGRFFVGCHVVHPPNSFPIPMDTSSPGATWAFGGGPAANYAAPNSNPVPLTNLLTAIGIGGPAILRVTCSGGASATYLCDPGVGGVIACPCSNPPSGSGKGCDNSEFTGGASLTAAGSPTVASDTLVFTTSGQTAFGTTIVMQGDVNNVTGVVFGQGVRCVDGNLLRLYVKAPGGTGGITAPAGGDPSVTAASAALGDTILAGQTRYYMAYYRDPIVLGGCPAGSTFNGTRAASVVWN